MRNAPPYRCPGCGAESDYPSRCDECEELYLDARGRPNVRPHVERWSVPRLRGPMIGVLLFALFVSGQVAMVTAWEGELQLDLFTIAAGALWAAFFGMLGWRLLGSMRASNLRAGARAALASLPARPVAEATGGRCRVRGRVRVLRPAADEDASVGAAFRRVKTSHSYKVQVYDRRGHRDVTRVETVVTETAECGRFAVIDASGVAIVDDDAFRVWSRSGRGLPAFRDGAFLAREGEEVEIVGPARAGEAEEVRDLAPAGSGYREGPPTAALIFDGTPDDPVWILVG